MPRILLGMSVLVATTAICRAAPVRVAHQGYLLGATDAPLDATGVTLGFSVWSHATASGTTDRVWPPTGESACVVDVAQRRSAPTSKDHS